MEMIGEFVSPIQDPAWPWSLSPFGLPALAVVALILAGLTIWTYLGVPRVGLGRILVMLGLRLLALFLASLMALRPSLAFKDNPHQSSTFLIVLDASASMTIQDMYDSQSRWDALLRILQESEPVLKKLQEEQNVSVVIKAFGEDIRDFDPQGQADGKRTDFGQMLHGLFDEFGTKSNLRCLLILSDGADNGIHYPPLHEAAKWRGSTCPIHTFGLGQPTTADRQSDLAFTAIYPEPAPVAVKGRLTVKGVLDAPGFENATVTVRLYLDNKEVLAQPEVLRKSTGNEILLVTDAPANPGEVKVSLKVDPLPKELTAQNNEIDTFVTVTKEGISVLYVDKLRFIEPQRICDALSPDPRIRLFVDLRRSDVSSGGSDLFQFDKKHYDVIILGDLTAQRLTAGNPQALQQIQDQIHKGAGLMMIGGFQSFGNSDWQNTPLADLLPVKLDATGQMEGPVQMEPTQQGFNHYLLRLADKPEDNAALWNKLPKLEGMTHLGEVKSLATVLAVRAGSREPLLVGQHYGEGRTLAFAADTTWRWEDLGQPKSFEGIKAHERFWKQVILWLARQDQSEGNAWIKPDLRRLAAGGKLGFTTGLRGKGGVDLQEAHLEVVAVGPQNSETPIPTSRDQGSERGTFWKTDIPGEYVLKVRARGKDLDGQEISGEASARFLVFQDDTEMVVRAANHDFLNRLATAGGGKFHEVKELPKFLKELEKLPLPQGKQKTEIWPEWRRNRLTGFVVGFFILFVAVLCLEWFLRRTWGLV